MDGEYDVLLLLSFLDEWWFLLSMLLWLGRWEDARDLPRDLICYFPSNYWYLNDSSYSQQLLTALAGGWFGTLIHCLYVLLAMVLVDWLWACWVLSPVGSWVNLSIYPHLCPLLPDVLWQKMTKIVILYPRDKNHSLHMLLQHTYPAYKSVLIINSNNRYHIAPTL